MLLAPSLFKVNNGSIKTMCQTYSKLIAKKKATGFNSMRINWCEINQIKSKYQIFGQNFFKKCPKRGHHH